MKESDDEIDCEKCGNSIDECKCICPYCGESDGCLCCVGYGCATGG